ncbi:MAG TPA: cell division protein ZapB [Syntrophales bacterium]|nr:cell division protein ZapB [Syntrophales bacterium]HRT27089.1 cell division protein ZapB [Syntrophales bacterium]
MELVKFSQLEEKIKGLIDQHALLKREKENLEGLLKKKEGELEEAKDTLKKLNEERDAIRAKVDSLLDMLHDIGEPQLPLR